MVFRAITAGVGVLAVVAMGVLSAYSGEGTPGTAGTATEQSVNLAGGHPVNSPAVTTSVLPDNDRGTFSRPGPRSGGPGGSGGSGGPRR